MPNPFPASAIKDLADEIRAYLKKHGLWQDTRIYFGGVAYDSGTEETLPDMDPSRYTEYSGDILTMTFEGPLYDALNYGPWKVEEELQAIFRKYGLYFEMGESWNLSAYPL